MARADPAFLIGELRRAFEMGFLLYLPFLVIDLVVGSVLMSLGMMMLPPSSISLPFKLIFFVLVDGWRLVGGQPGAGFRRLAVMQTRMPCALPSIAQETIVKQPHTEQTIDHTDDQQNTGNHTSPAPDARGADRFGDADRGGERRETSGQPRVVETDGCGQVSGWTR